MYVSIREYARACVCACATGRFKPFDLAALPPPITVTLNVLTGAKPAL